MSLRQKSKRESLQHVIFGNKKAHVKNALLLILEYFLLFKSLLFHKL